MNEFFKHILKDKIIFYCFSSGLFLIIASVLYMFFSYRLLPPLIPVFNQLPWGDARIAEKKDIFIPIMLVIVIMTVNLLLSFHVYKTTPLLSRILSVTFAIASLLVFIFIIKTAQMII